MSDRPSETTPLFSQHSTTAPRTAKHPRRHVSSLVALAALSSILPISVLAREYGTPFSLAVLHPILMSLSFFFAAIAIAVGQTRRHLLAVPLLHLFGTKITVRPRVHAVLAGTSGVLALAGIAAKFVAKEEAGRPHFQSTHAIAGLVTVGAVAVQSLYGAVASYYPKLAGGAIVARKGLRAVHRRAGYLLLAGNVVTVWYGVNYLGLGQAADTLVRVAVVGTAAGLAARSLLIV